MNDPARGETVADYKRLLQTVCENRPSGTRVRLAVALGTNRSFVSQLVNPAYSLPIPAQHLETIFEICHFSPTEKRDFLEAFGQAQVFAERRQGLLGQPTGRLVAVAGLLFKVGDVLAVILDHVAGEFLVEGPAMHAL